MTSRPLPTSVQPGQGREGNNFRLLRLLLAFSVVAFHIAFLSRVPSMAWFANDGWSTAGMHGFFFISGFLVVMSYDRSRSLAQYGEARARRIFPAYAVAVIGAALLLAFASRLSAHEYFASPGLYRYIVLNLGLSNFLSPSLPGVFEHNMKQAVNGSLWTIKIEVMFYLLVPGISWAVRRWGAQVALPALAIGSIVWGTGLQSLGQHLHRPFLEQLAVQVPGQLCYFCAGTWAYYRRLAGAKPPSALQALIGAAIYTGVDGVLWQVLSPLAVYLVLGWASLSLRPLRSPLGKVDISYGVFLSHWPILQVAIACGAFAKMPWTSAAACCLLSALAGCISWFAIERPALGRNRGEPNRSLKSAIAVT